MTDPDPPRPNFNVYVSATAVKLRRFKIAAGYYALQGNSAVFAWNPEEQLPVEERRIIMPHEFRSSPEVVLVDARVLTALNGAAMPPTPRRPTRRPCSTARATAGRPSSVTRATC
jgi:hypothetical protein